MILRSEEYLALSAWNLIFTIASLFIGIGIIKNKYWAYQWGIGTAVKKCNLGYIPVIWPKYSYSSIFCSDKHCNDYSFIG